MAKNSRPVSRWLVTYQYGRPPGGLFAGMPGTGKTEFQAKGNDKKARLLAMALICRQHIVAPEGVEIVTLTNLEDCNAPENL